MEKIDRESGPSASQSPRFFRKKSALQATGESTNVQGRVALGEVEQKLKSMRQKRLDRLSTFVADQTKLAEERAVKNVDGNEIENAIMSIKQSAKEERKTFKSINEENTEKSASEESLGNERSSIPRTPKLFRKFSDESMEKSKQFQKPSSTRKFINKFNCATMADGNSIEDLTNDTEYKKSSAISLGHERHYTNRNSQENRDKAGENATNMTEHITENYSPLLTPEGKQRKGIYFYDTECKFLENEKLPVLSTFKNTENNVQIVRKYSDPLSVHTEESINKPGRNNHNETATYKFPEKTLERCGETSSVINSSKNLIADVKLDDNHNKQTITSHEGKPKVLMKTFKRNSVSDIVDDINLKVINSFNRLSAESLHVDNKINDVTHQSNQNKLESKFTAYENIHLKLKDKETVPTVLNKNVINNKDESKENIFMPLKSPMPLPRIIGNEEKTLKKFQRNWDSLNEILKNDSDVDSDELEDLKKTLDDTNELLVQYGKKLKILEEKSRSTDNYLEKLNIIVEELKELEKEVTNFRGLKRDIKYTQLSDRLSNFLSEIHKIRANNADFLRSKKAALVYTENCIRNLEKKAFRNKCMLIEVLEAQVTSISTNIFNITKV